MIIIALSIAAVVLIAAVTICLVCVLFSLVFS